MAGVPCEQLPARTDELWLLSASAYDNPGRRDNLTYYYDDAGCYDYNDPAGNHDRGYYNYNNNDNHNGGGEFLR